MVGSPFQTTECLVDDLMFIKELQPHMVGIGPFIPHKDTPFAGKPAVPGADIVPSRHHTANASYVLLRPPQPWHNPSQRQGTGYSCRRKRGNAKPFAKEVRSKYLLYDNKICTGDEAAECRMCLTHRIESIGYKLVVSRGDCKKPN